MRQLAGMRGLMAKPSGEIIETPITANFREGLNVLQYFISTHGARKGWPTPPSRPPTRATSPGAWWTWPRTIITSDDCQTLEGIEVSRIEEAGEIIAQSRDRIVGRTVLEDLRDPLTGEVILERNALVDEDLATAIQDAGIENVKIRSVLTCESRRGCASAATAATWPPAAWSSGRPG